MHDPPAAIELPQVLDSENGAAALTETPVAAVLPGLETVTVCAALVDPVVTLPNDRLVGDAVSALAPLTPVPVSATVSGLLGALLATERVPVDAPTAVGL